MVLGWILDSCCLLVSLTEIKLLPGLQKNKIIQRAFTNYGELDIVVQGQSYPDNSPQYDEMC